LNRQATRSRGYAAGHIRALIATFGGAGYTTGRTQGVVCQLHETLDRACVAFDEACDEMGLPE